MARVELSPAAERELLTATAWYLDRSPAAAAAFAKEIDRAIQRIGDAAERYPMTRNRRRRFVLINFPFSVVYRMRESYVEVIAIAHHSRRPGYWRTR